MYQYLYYNQNIHFLTSLYSVYLCFFYFLSQSFYSMDFWMFIFLYLDLIYFDVQIIPLFPHVPFVIFFSYVASGVFLWCSFVFFFIFFDSIYTFFAAHTRDKFWMKYVFFYFDILYKLIIFFLDQMPFILSHILLLFWCFLQITMNE